MNIYHTMDRTMLVYLRFLSKYISIAYVVITACGSSAHAQQFAKQQFIERQRREQTQLKQSKSTISNSRKA